ncbi:MAG: flagellar assembly protein FliH [Hyphomicrobiales bacterium]|nr:flagellar assembly protein FliH [Hyphomicrobiales bacterium]
MTEPARFMFDIDFAEPGNSETSADAPPKVDHAAHLAAIAAAEARGLQRGVDQGRTGAEATAAQVLAVEAGRLADAAAALMATLDNEQRRYQTEAIDLAVTVARKLAAALIAREPLAEVEALVGECLGPLRKTPHLVVRTSTGQIDALRQVTDRLAFEKGFEGRLVLLAEDDLAVGDCRIEWADGGIDRSRVEIDRQIDSIIDRFLAARSNTETENRAEPPAGNETSETENAPQGGETK